MNDFIFRLQEDKRFTLVALAFAVVLSLMVGAVAFNKLQEDKGSSVAAGSDAQALASPEVESDESPDSEPEEDNTDESSSDESSSEESSSDERSAEEEAEADAAIDAISSGLDVATTTTEKPKPEPTTTEPPAEDSKESEAPKTTTEAPAPEEGFVDAGHGVQLPAVMLKIRYCESRDNYTVLNTTGSGAAGAYQFLKSSWKAYGHAERYGVDSAEKASPAQQDEAALITWKQSGTRPWAASQRCWG